MITLTDKGAYYNTIGYSAVYGDSALKAPGTVSTGIDQLYKNAWYYRPSFSNQCRSFGNLGDPSGTGVAFTRNPANGVKEFYGEFLINAQGEDVVAGIRNTVSLADMAEIDRQSHDDLMTIMTRLERHYRDMCDIEFTVERGKLWMLQTRSGKRTGAAAVKIAVDLAHEVVADLKGFLDRSRGANVPWRDARVFDTRIRRNVKLAECPSFGKHIFEYAPWCPGAPADSAVLTLIMSTTPTMGRCRRPNHRARPGGR